MGYRLAADWFESALTATKCSISKCLKARIGATNWANW